jgi:hypothetical protein
MAKSGETVPSGGLIEFLVPADREGDVDQSKEPGTVPRAEKRMFWDTADETIDCLFGTSARYCLELRSLSPDCEEEAISHGQQPQVQAGGLARLPAQPLKVIAEAAMVTKASGNGATRRGYRSEIRAYMKSHTLRTKQIAARHFGVGVDTLKSMMSSKGKPRFSEDTLKNVLDKIGHEEP